MKRLLNPNIYFYIEPVNGFVPVGVLLLPEAACGITQHLGGMEVELPVIVVIRGRVPVRVGDNDTVGQNSQSILNDWHLQSITG